MRENRAIVATVAKVHVLVVEDDPDTREIYEDTLRHAGYDVVTAGSLAEAEDAAQERRPDLVVLDCRLPDGSGIDLLRRWKASAAMAGVPIVMVTAHSGQEFIRSASSAGADAFLVKPCWGDLTAFLARLVHNTRNQPPPLRAEPQFTAKRQRYRITSPPPVPSKPALALVKKSVFDENDGKLLARCRTCFRGSPVLGNAPREAERRAINLGWSLHDDVWTCPVCIERRPRSD